MLNKYKPELRGAVAVVATWIGIGTIVFHSIENWTWIESLYFSVTTLTTIGYGDLHPTTDASRLIDVFYILFGVTAVLSAVTIIGNKRVDRRISKVEKKQDSKQ